jgi:hypothetical protein
MALHDQASPVAATVEVTLWVPRGAAGDLRAGTREVLDGVDAVASVESVDIGAVRPTATDIRLDLVAELRLRIGEGPAAAALADGFGVLSAEVLAVETAEIDEE